MRSSTTTTRQVTAHAVSGAVWLLAQSIVSRSVGFVGQLILAKILDPDDFGIIGTSLTLYNIANVVSVFGFDQVLMRRSLRHAQWLSAAIFAVLCATSIAIGLTALAVVTLPIASKAAVAKISLVLAPGVFATSLGYLPQVVIQGQMRFRLLAAINILEGLCSQIIIISLAAIGVGAVSFAIGTVLVSLCRAAFLFTKAPAFVWAAARKNYRFKLIRAGALALGSRLLSTLIDQGDYLIISLVGGISDVGFYFFAFRLASQAMRTVAGNLANVMVPALVRLGDRPRQIAAAFRAAEVLAFIAMPVCFLQVVNAAPIIALLFGEKWEGAVFYIKILSFGLPFDAMAWAGGALLTARGHYKRLLGLNFCFGCIFMALAAVGAASAGAKGVAIGVAGFYAIHGIVALHLVFSSEVGALKTIKCYLQPAAFSMIASLSGFIGASPLGEIVLRSLAFLTIFISLYIIFEPNAIWAAWQIIKSRGQALSSPGADH